MTSYRDEALAKLDVRQFFAGEGVQLLDNKRAGADEVRFVCPFHADSEPSANVNLKTGLWKCQVCNIGGSPIDFLMRGGADYKAALERVGQVAGLAPPGKRTNGAAGNPSPAAPSPSRTKLTQKNVTGWHEAALRNPDLQSWFRDHRGYTDETVKQFELGWDGERVTIPVRNEQGDLVNVRRYLRDASEGLKFLPLYAGSGPDVTTRLFPVAGELPDEVVLVEGEWDAMLCHQHGLDNAVSMTAGAGNWNSTFTPWFEGRKVTIVYDNDDAGRRGAARIAGVLSSALERVEISILQIPNLPPKGDVTDFFVEQGRTVDELRQLIAEATPYLAAPTVEEEPEAVEVALHRASDATNRGRRLALPVLLSGKAMTPYTIPYEIDVSCDLGNKRFCSVCPMQEAAGRKTVTLNAADPAVLQLVNVTGEQQYTAIKALAKAVKQCNHPQVEVKKSINVEELRLIPELDTTIDQGGDTEYVSRQGFFLGHGLLPNRGYTMKGYTHPHPKTQATVHLLSEAEPAQDNISAFAVTPELIDRLKIFQAPAGHLEERLSDIYDDFATSVHKIRDRADMQIAYDLVWHSAIAFTFNGALVRRGWVEALVMGDSGQGKSEMATTLLQHYGLGERVQSEQSSLAGLIGGLEKMGDTWLLSWGRIPLNDKRLLIIDEAHGLAGSTVEAMSDVRASGVAEITKIRTERTNARCRIIWLANPVSGLTLGQHNQGVLAVKELFKKPEDVRRLDLALTVASGDVDFASSINVRRDESGDPKYSSAACRSLILWAWSRRPDQVEFSTDATDLILSSATSMAQRYHASIPLVEPSDQRLKLARLAVAAAARVYSASDDGERIRVEREHVEFVASFLEHVYSSPAMAYDEYSDTMRKGEVLDEDDEDLVRRSINSWENRDDAIAFLRSVRTFKRQELIDGVGWEPEYARAQLKTMTAHRLIRTVRDGYVKAPAFISLLRTLAGAKIAVPVEPGEDDPF